MTVQSAAAHTQTHVLGSCKIEFSSNSGTTWENLGLARNVAWKENWTKQVIQCDNGENIKDAVGEQTITISFNGLELYLPTLYTLRGIDTYAITSGARTTDSDVYTTGQYGRGDVIWLQHQGTTAVMPVITWVKSKSTAGVTSTYAATKFVQITDTDNHNRRGVCLMTSAAGASTAMFKSTDSLRIKYQYTPITSYKLKSGGLTTLNTKWYRLTNKEYIGGVAKYRYFTIYSGSIEEGLNLAFKSSNEADPILECPMTITGRVDGDRSAGDQLFVIEDEVTHA